MMCGGMERKKIAALTLIITGLFLMITGVLTRIVFKIYFHKLVKETIRLTNGSDIFSDWVSEPDVALTFNIYFFNVTNPDDILLGGRAKLNETGPYSFRLKSVKKDVRWFSEGNKVNYSMYNFFYQGNTSLLDEITTLNMPAWGVMEGLEYSSIFLKEAASATLATTRSHLFKRLSIEDLLFKGYSDLLVKLLHVLEPEKAPDKFGYFYKKNGTDNGDFTVATGLENSEKFNEILTYNGETNLNFWYSDYSNTIRGGDGGMFPPFLDNKEKDLDIFFPDMFRSVTYSFDHEEKYHGLNLWSFSLNSHTFSYSLDERNTGFCLPLTNGSYRCPPDGLLNISSCTGSNTSMYVSSPHFYHVDPSLHLPGLDPDPTLHSSYLLLEPNLGVMIRSAHRLQLSARLRQIPGFGRILREVPTFYLPLMWYESVAVLDDRRCDQIRDEFEVVQVAVEVASYVLECVGLVCLLVGFFMLKKLTCDKYYENTRNTKELVEHAEADESSPLLATSNGGQQTKNNQNL